MEEENERRFSLVKMSGLFNVMNVYKLQCMSYICMILLILCVIYLTFLFKLIA